MGNFYKNQEIQITAKFIGVADDGKIQVKIKGIDDITLNIDRQYINASGSNKLSPIPSSTTSATPSNSPPHYKKKKSIKQKKRMSIIQKQAELDKAADDAWGDSDDEPQQEEELHEEADDEDVKEAEPEK